MKKYIRLIRVKHYIKNVLVFAPLIFSGNLFCLEKLKVTILGGMLFSFTASIVYIINDIRDVEKDKKHPTKKDRPIASGQISVSHAFIVIVVLLVCIVSVGMLTKYRGGVYLLLYFITNVLYSMGLKNKPIVDIALLVSGFLIRILYGASLINVTVSYWLYLTVASMAFYLVLGKRRNEFIQNKELDTRHVLKSYSFAFLDKHMYMCLSLAIIFYSLWAVETPNGILVLTVPVVLLICMKYNLNVEGDSDGDPIEIVFRDKILILMCGLYGLLLLGALYIG